MQASISTIKDMLTHRKQFVQFRFMIACKSISWCADLVSFMPHIRWLSVIVSAREGMSRRGSPFTLAGPLNLTYLAVSRKYYSGMDQIP